MFHNCNNHRTNYWFQNLLLPTHGHTKTLLQLEENSRNHHPKQQEMKTMKRHPKKYKTIKYSAQNQQTTLQPDFDHTQ